MPLPWLPDRRPIKVLVWNTGDVPTDDSAGGMLLHARYGDKVVPAEDLLQLEQLGKQILKQRHTKQVSEMQT